MIAAPPERPPQQLAEFRREPRVHPEVVNALTHGFGLIMSIVALVFLASTALTTDDTWRVVGCATFGLTLVILYTSSTLLHCARTPERMLRLEVLDHCAIYLLVAGTYTPLFASPMWGAARWPLLSTAWVLAIAGICFKITFGVRRYPAISVGSYLALGWFPVLVLKQLIEHMSAPAVIWLVLGGVLYTAGVPFYLSRRFVYSHGIWHLFVLAGSACHFIAIVLGVLRPH